MNANETWAEPEVSFDSFFEAHYDRTRRLLMVMLGDEGKAEESAQEAFARAFRDWPTVSVMNRPAGWVLTVGLNHARDSLRHARLADRYQRAHAVGETSQAQPRDLDLIAELRRLPLRQRQAVVLRFLVDLPLDEVAAQMDCAVGTVKSTLHKALAKLRIASDDAGESQGVNECE